MQEEVVVKNEGKTMGIAGFVLALVTLIFSSWVAAASVAMMISGGSGWLMYLWLVLALASIVISVMGMSKSKRSGGKRGLAIAGMVIGIVSSVYCLILALGLSAAASMSSSLVNDAEFQDAMQELENLSNQH